MEPTRDGGDSGFALQQALEDFVRGRRPLPAVKLKENRVRTVWRVELPPHGPLLVKHYRYVRFYDRVRYAFLREKAQKEAENLARLHALGIAVARSFFWKRMGPAEALFAGEFLADAVSWPDAASAEDARRLGEAVRLLHAARFYHRDLHLGNVLIAHGRLYIIDFHGGFFLPFLPRRCEVRMLAMLCASLEARGQGGLLGCFLDACTGGHGAAMEVRVLRAAARLGARRLVSRSRRCLIRSTAFAVERRGWTRIYRRRTLERDVLETLLEAQGVPASSAWDAVVTRHATAGGAVWRIRAAGGAWRGAPVLRRWGRLYRAWYGLHALAVRGVPAVHGLAYVGRLVAGPRFEETLLVRAPEDMAPLNDALAACADIPGTEGCRVRLAFWEDLGAFMTGLHAACARAPDFGPHRILAARDGLRWRFMLQAVEGMRLGRLSAAVRREAFVRLAAGMPGSVRGLALARLLARYDGGSLWNRPSVRRLRRCVLRHVRSTAQPANDPSIWR